VEFEVEMLVPSTSLELKGQECARFVSVEAAEASPGIRQRDLSESSRSILIGRGKS
jgi:hypothetical protein